MAAEGRQQELERANLEEIVTKIEADTVPAADSCDLCSKVPSTAIGLFSETVPNPTHVPRMRPPPPRTWDGLRVRNSRNVSFKLTGAAS